MEKPVHDVIINTGVYVMNLMSFRIFPKENVWT